jgi:hypothetical protein
MGTGFSGGRGTGFIGLGRGRVREAVALRAAVVEVFRFVEVFAVAGVCLAVEDFLRGAGFLVFQVFLVLEVVLAVVALSSARVRRK